MSTHTTVLAYCSLTLNFRLKLGGRVWYYSRTIHNLQPKSHVLLVSGGGTARLLLSWRYA